MGLDQKSSYLKLFHEHFHCLIWFCKLQEQDQRVTFLQEVFSKTSDLHLIYICMQKKSVELSIEQCDSVNLDCLPELNKAAFGQLKLYHFPPTKV